MSRVSVRIFSLAIVLFAIAAAPFGAAGRFVGGCGIVIVSIILGIYEALRDRSRDDLPEKQYVPGLGLSQREIDESDAREHEADDRRRGSN